MKRTRGFFEGIFLREVTGKRISCYTGCIWPIQYDESLSNLLGNDLPLPKFDLDSFKDLPIRLECDTEVIGLIEKLYKDEHGNIYIITQLHDSLAGECYFALSYNIIVPGDGEMILAQTKELLIAKELAYIQEEARELCRVKRL